MKRWVYEKLSKMKDLKITDSPLQRATCASLLCSGKTGGAAYEPVLHLQRVVVRLTLLLNAHHERRNSKASQLQAKTEDYPVINH